MKPSFDASCDADVVDKVALNERAVKLYSAFQNRTPEQKNTALENRKALSSIAGVAELQGLEADYYLLNIYRDSPVLDFVEMRNLPLGAIPFYRTRSMNPVGFYHGSVNAMGANTRYITNDSATQVFTYTVTTDEVEIPNLNAIYDMARLEQRQAALDRLALDMRIALVNCNLNTMLRVAGDVVTYDPAQAIQDYVTNSTGSFGGKNVFLLDPGVQATSVPSTNIIDATSEGGLTKGVFQALNDYRLFAKRRLRKIYVPSANSGTAVWRAMQNQASIVALVTGQGNANPAKAVPDNFWKEFQDADFGGIVTVNWFGLNVDIEVQNWLPAGYCLVLTDRPASIMWDRLNLSTGQDQAGTLEVPINGYNSRRSEARQIGTISPDFCLLNFVVLKVA